jgi:uncharacterized protein (TIGR00106 family)
MMLMEFSMSPLSQGESVSKFVARSLEIVAASGLDYELHAMGTIVEGETAEVLQVLQQCFLAMQQDCQRITCTAKFDFRTGHQGRIRAKVTSVERQLGRKLKTGAADES